MTAGEAEGKAMSDNWNFACVLILSVAGFMMGYASNSVWFNMATVFSGCFILAVANGMIAALTRIVTDRNLHAE